MAYDPVVPVQFGQEAKAWLESKLLSAGFSTSRNNEQMEME